MTHDMIQRLTTLVNFLGNVLGPDYEIALYDLELDNHPVIAIANGRVSGQTIGSPLPEVAQGLLSQKQYEQGDYVLNFTSHLRSTGKAIRSSVMFIRDDTGKLSGLLGINFDDSRFLSLSNSLLNRIHPQDSLPHSDADPRIPQTQPAADTAPWKGALHNDVAGMIQEIFAEMARALPVPPDRLTQDERIAFIAQLKQHGMFRLKGAVQYTAENLGCSQASIYRYLSKI